MKINPNLTENKFQAAEMKKKQNNEFKQTIKNKIKSKGKEDTEDEELKKVSEEFEAIFVNLMFKEMKKAGFKSKLLDSGLGRDIFEDMYYRELAKTTAKRANLGIAEGVYRQLNKLK